MLGYSGEIERIFQVSRPNGLLGQPGVAGPGRAEPGARGQGQRSRRTGSGPHLARGGSGPGESARSVTVQYRIEFGFSSAPMINRPQTISEIVDRGDRSTV